MTNRLFEKVCTPSDQDQLLTRAAVVEGDAGWEAWLGWRRGADLEAIRDSSIRLLPLIYQRFQGRLKDDSLAPIMKGVYRRTWYKNQMLVAQARKVVAVFQQNSIPNLLLKGIPLMLGYYSDLGVRPMQDVDIVVPRQKVDQAIGILEKMGYRYRELRPLEFMRDFTHGAEFFSGSMGRIDLHWNILHELRSPDVDDLFWKTAKPLDLGGVQALVPDSAHLLAHICLHGSWWAQFPSFKWIPDAAVILKHDPELFDWKSVLRLAQFQRLALPLRDALTYLQDRMGILIPDGVRETLKNLSVPEKEKAIYEWRLLPYSLRGRKRFFGTLTWLWSYYEHEAMFAERGKDRGITGWGMKVSGFLNFLMSRYDAKSRRHLVVILLSKVLRRPYIIFR